MKKIRSLFRFFQQKTPAPVRICADNEKSPVLDRVQVPRIPAGQPALRMTVYDGSDEPVTYRLNGFGKDVVTFGQSPANDIVLTCRMISDAQHGRFVRENGVWYIEEREVFDGMPSAHGILHNGDYVTRQEIHAGDIFRIGSPYGTIGHFAEMGPNDVHLAFSADDTDGT